MAVSNRMVWIDLEMTGLDPLHDGIIEIATLITDGELEIVAEGPEIVIHQSEELLGTMDEWNVEHHTQSGLVERVRSSSVSTEQAEEQTLAFLAGMVGNREAPLCGNSVWQDRRFLTRYMPRVDAFLHYRLVDVSSIKELVQRWYPKRVYRKKTNQHRALDDIRESIDELRYYREHIFRAPGV